MFFNALLVGALASFAAAQSAVLTFTNVPNPVTAGNPTALVWATNDTVSVSDGRRTRCATRFLATDMRRE